MSRPLTTASVVDFGVDRTDAEPIHVQIARQLRELVLSGRLKPEVKLPSTRALAQDLKVARATVVEAYDQLLGEGYLETSIGSGTRVAAQLPETLLAAAPRAAKAKPSLIHANKRVAAKPFRSGLVDWEHFPHDEWGRILGRFWRNPPIALLEHNDPLGWLPLRHAISQHLFEWRGLECEAEQVIVTAGGMDAFDLIQRATLKAGDALWLEEPGYATARHVFAQAGLKIISVPVDAEGLVVERGRKMAPHAKAAFVTPARQYPTGVTMPLSRRLELLDWAAGAGATIIEDDYDSEYRYVGRPLPALMSLDSQARVIYSGTFSKVFSPLVRLGFLVVPKHLLGPFREARAVHGAPPSLIVQPALASFMASGAFAVHIRRMRRIYAIRREALIAALQPGHGKYYQLEASPSGLMLLLRLSTSDVAVAQELAKAGVQVQTLSSHYGGTEKSQGLLLSFAGFPERELQNAAKILVETIAAFNGAST
ncbi:MAG: PLP-dependent aminotransferase family protein [Alphaproteobacteria bacterium]|nr:PLP-dependent aminotransferase family protein [Alphaproteobacteria bacterium]